MRLATLPNGTRDGRLVVVSADQTRAAYVPGCPTLQAALDDWTAALPPLQAASLAVEQGGIAFDPAQSLAPLPRAYQWLDGSAYLNHGRLMQQAFNLPPNDEAIPLMYQGGSDDFSGPHAPAHFPDPAHGIDFEAEFGVVLDDVPMGTSAAATLAHIRLIVLLNDWSLRALAPREMKAGFGFLQAKPATAFAPLAVTPGALHGAFRGGRLHLTMQVALNGVRFGHLDASLMDHDFGTLIAFAARTRHLRAGTIIGSGTVSNPDRAAGSGCLQERRVIQIIDHGTATIPFMTAGDSVDITALAADGSQPFGTIRQTVTTGQNDVQPFPHQLCLEPVAEPRAGNGGQDR